MVCTTVTVQAPAPPTLSNIGFGDSYGRFTACSQPNSMVGSNIGVWFDVSNTPLGSINVRVSWVKDGVNFTQTYYLIIVYGVPSMVATGQFWAVGTYSSLTVAVV